MMREPFFEGRRRLTASLVGLLAIGPSWAAAGEQEPKIQGLKGALEFAQSDGRIPPGLKLEAIKVLQTSEEDQYSLTFREGGESHIITIRDRGDFKTQTRRAPADNPTFWESAPAPAALITTTEERIESAKAEVQKAGGIPGDVVMAEYRAGYRQSDAFKGQWTIHVGLKGEAPKGKVKAKTVIFTDERVTKLSDGELQLSRRPF